MSSAATPQLKLEIKQLVLQTLKITDVTPDQIGDGVSFFEGDGPLKLDSVDALELIVALQRKYKVHIDDQNLGRVIVTTVDSIAEFVAKSNINNSFNSFGKGSAL